MRLDCYWGTFSGIGGAALNEALAELRQEEYNQRRKEMEHQQELDDEEFNELLDCYYDQIAKKKKALEYLSELQIKYNQLVDLYNTANSEKETANAALRSAQAELMQLRQGNTQLLKEKLIKDRENIELSGKLDEAVNKHNAHLKHVEKNAQTIENSFKVKQRIKVNAEQTFSLIQNREALEKMEAMMSTKVAYTQNLVLKKIVAKQVALGFFKPNEYAKIELEILKAEDEKDIQRQGITYTESLDWLKVHNPKRLDAILNFKI